MYTGWVVGGDASEMWRRALTDAHPPVYYLSLFLFSRVAGISDSGLRLFSAICAVFSVVVFLWGTRDAYSRTARYYAAAMATTSSFWFYNAQNARSYGLCLLFAAILMVMSLKLVRADKAAEASGEERRGWGLASAIVALSALSCFVHSYMALQAIALSLTLALLLKRRRILFAVAAVGLLGLFYAYLKIVISRFSQFNLGENWIQGSAHWYLSRFSWAFSQTFGSFGTLSFVLCVIALLYVGARALKPALAGRADGARPSSSSAFSMDASIGLVLLTPLVTWAGAVASSILIAPNVTERNLLVVSPFLWAAIALTYDRGVRKLAGPTFVVLVAALSVLTVIKASIVGLRLVERNEPHAPTAQFIRGFPACAGAIIPVIYTASPAYSKPGYDQAWMGEAFRRPLENFARPTVVYLDDLKANRLSPDLRTELAARLAGRGCPVLAWSAHEVSAPEPGPIAHAIATDLGRLDLKPRIRAETYSFWRSQVPSRQVQNAGYVIYVPPGTRAEATKP